MEICVILLLYLKNRALAVNKEYGATRKSIEVTMVRPVNNGPNNYANDVLRGPRLPKLTAG